MPSDYTIRSAAADEVQPLVDLLKPLLQYAEFSRGLLEEKLLLNPLPNHYEMGTLIAESNGTIAGMMQHVIRRDTREAWIGLFGVAAEQQHCGIASELLRQTLAKFRQAGCKLCKVLTIPGNYFSPGLDPRYTAALTFLERHGFERGRDCVNMLADLSSPLDTNAEVTALAAKGVTVRRVTLDDVAMLDTFFAKDFGAGWRLEAELALRNDPPAIHIALKDGEMIAFSAHSTQNREWGYFGPMGTTPAARGTGLGRILLLRCLEDLREAGHKTAIIPWVGPIGFYARNVRCHVERVFWHYQLNL
jgi:mycothiol synthase